MTTWTKGENWTAMERVGSRIVVAEVRRQAGTDMHWWEVSDGSGWKVDGMMHSLRGAKSAALAAVEALEKRLEVAP